MRQTQHLENFLQDLRYAVRMLGKSPAFTVVTILTLTQGVLQYLTVNATSVFANLFDGCELVGLRDVSDVFASGGQPEQGG